MIIKKKQKGSALLMSLIALSVVAILAAKSFLFIDHSGKVVSSQLAANKNFEFLLAGEAWIEQQLIINTWPDKQGQILSEVNFDIEDGQLGIVVIDFDSCINLNKLAVTDTQVETQNALINLSSTVGVSSDWVGLIKDWVDEDSQTSLTGAEDGFYMAKDKPHRTANNKVIGDYEWSLLNLDDVEFAEVLPFVCAINDTNSTINLNTAPSKVLQALIPNLSSTQAAMLLEERRNKPFSDLNDVNSDPRFKGLDLKKSDWATKTKNVFGVVTLTREDQTYWLQTLVSNDANGIVKSNNRVFLSPNEYVKWRLEVNENE